ncbi:MAG: V-type ATPase subunit, partial [bacterium]|nr:V-type ATPase subunit [bacterium]
EDVAKILPEDFLRHYELEEVEAIEKFNVHQKIRIACKAYLEHKLLWKLEKDLEEAELSVIKDAKYKTDGPEPIVGYFYGKKNAVRNVRLILTAKQNEIAVEKIKERVRDLY